MNGTTISTCAVPAALWRPSPRVPDGLDVIQDLIQEVLTAERRLGKRVHEDANRERHEDAAELLEQAVLRRAANDARPARGAFAAFVAGSGYLALLAELWLLRRSGEDTWSQGRQGASIVPPEEVASHLEQFSAVAASTGRLQDPDIVGRIEFLHKVVVPSGCGVVEALTFEPDTGPDTVLAAPASLRRQRPGGDIGQQTSGRVDVEQVFRERVARALETGAPVNMNNQNHVIITRVLAEYLPRHREHPPGAIRVVYGDGSEAPPFPLRCLDETPFGAEEQVHPIALMSMRHLPLDENVVVNWLRNREVDQSSTMAQSDVFCYRQSVRQLRELRRACPGRVLIHLYHTGFEPGIVAFYRAAVEAMRDGSLLRIVPHYFLGDGEFETGPSWPALNE